MIHLNFSQIIDSQIDSELLDSILENDIISLSGGKSDTDLLGHDLDLNLNENMDTTKPYSILDELVACPPTHNTKHQYSTTKSKSKNTPSSPQSEHLPFHPQLPQLHLQTKFAHESRQTLH